MNASVKGECKYIGSIIIFINELQMKNRYGKRIEMEKNWRVLTHVYRIRYFIYFCAEAQIINEYMPQVQFRVFCL